MFWRKKQQKQKYYTVNELERIAEKNEGYTVYRDMVRKNSNIQVSKDVKPIVQKKDIFDNIVGHESLKTIFNNALKSEEQIHILLTGASGTSKSLFLEAIADNIKNSYFITNNSTGAGILSYLYEHPDLKILLIDEVEKLRKDEISVLLTLMESGRLVITKKSLMVNRKQQIKIFATCNNKHRLASEMLSRFLKFTLKPYTFFEFMQIANSIITKRFKGTPLFAEKIGKAVWEEMGSRDIRDVIKVATLTKNEDEIDKVIKALAYYSDELNNGSYENDGEEEYNI